MLNELHRIEHNLNTVILGKSDQVRLALCCVLAEGHLLLEDLPGMGKTTLAHALANAMGLSYKRVQFTNDILPGDLLGMNIYDARSAQFYFQAGPVFSQLLLADEINRASPKTQSALLEAMEERQVSIDGETRPLPSPFFVIATQNPLFHAGTSALPESQLDRFLFRLSLGFPTPQAEKQLLRDEQNGSRLGLLDTPLAITQLKALQLRVPQVHIAEAVLDYVLALLQQSRHQAEMLPLSPRAGKALVRAAKAMAFINNRHYVTAEDVQRVFPYVAEHRLNPQSAADKHPLSKQLLQTTPCEL